MEYQQEVLDRATGRLETKSIGEWTTITELGERYGVGPKTTRLILHQMGILAKEGVRFRLPRSLVDAGFGLRHDKPKSGYPFDVFSPHGQAVIDQGWLDARADYEKECRNDGEVAEVRSALNAFKASRQEALDTRQATYWVLDHHPKLLLKTVATVLEVSPALVTRYSKARKARKDALRRAAEAELQRFPSGCRRIRKSAPSAVEPVELIRWQDKRAMSDGSITQEIYTAENGVAGFGIASILRYAPSLYRMSPAQRHHRVWGAPQGRSQ